MLNSPVLRYELLTLGRRRRYTLLRCAYVGGLLFALWLCYLEAFGWYGRSSDTVLAAYARLAEYFFATFAGIQLGAILLLTPAVVAGTIAGEHERRTIDYLLTTHLTDSEIALSKFASRMLALVYQLLVGLPVLALVMLFGGIAPETLFEVFGYSALVLLATASLSLWISASSKQSRSAITTTYLVVIVLVGLPLLGLMAVEIMRDFHQPSAFTDAVMIWNLWSPIFLIVNSFEPIMPGHAAWHRPEYIVPLYLTASAVWLVLAVRAVRRTHGKVSIARRWWWSRKEKPSRTVGRYAMLWKETICQRGVLKLGWLGRLATILLFAAAYIALGCAIWQTIQDELDAHHWRYYGQSVDPFGYQIPFSETALHITSCCLSAIVGCFILLLLTARTAGSATVEKEQDSWLTLLSTPFTPREIVLGKIGGAFYSVRYWYLFLAIVWLCGAMRFPYQFATMPLHLASHLILGWLCCAIGMYVSLKLKTSLWSIGSALATVATAFGGLPMFAILLLETNRSYRQDELNALGFLAPAFLFAPEHLIARYACGYTSRSSEDATILCSCLAAALIYTTAAVIITKVIIRSFDPLTGRIAELAQLTSTPESPS